VNEQKPDAGKIADAMLDEAGMQMLVDATPFSKPLGVMRGEWEAELRRQERAIEDATKTAGQIRRLLGMPSTAAQGATLTDGQILALNAGEVYFSETPTKYPEAGHGTQYHCGAPGLLKFARALLAAAPTPVADSGASEPDWKSRALEAEALVQQLRASQAVQVIPQGVMGIPPIGSGSATCKPGISFNAAAKPVSVDDGNCESCVGDKCVTGPRCVTLGRDSPCQKCKGSGYLSDGNHCQWCALPVSVDAGGMK
jgi:hypothetical protein